MPRFHPGKGPRFDLVPEEEQTAAVFYLLGDGARSLEPYADPSVTERMPVSGGERMVADLQAGLLKGLLTGRRLALLDSQSQRGEGAYSPAKLGRDVSEAVWGNLEQASPTERALPRAYVSQTRQLIAHWSNAAAKESAEAQGAIAAGLPAGFSSVESDTGNQRLCSDPLL